MIDAVMFWNEPTSWSHRDGIDQEAEWRRLADVVNGAADAVAAVNPDVPRVLGGMSPLDPAFVLCLEHYDVLSRMDAVAVHGFPLDWNHGPLKDWPRNLAEIRAVTDLPVWVSEIGLSTGSADAGSCFGLERTMALLLGRTPRLHWFSLYEGPRTSPPISSTTMRQHEPNGAGASRPVYTGLLREDGTPTPSLDLFARHAPDVGLFQWFHFEDPRLDDAVRWMRELGVRQFRTGLSWADSRRPGAEAWFDRLMGALAPFDVTVTFCLSAGSQRNGSPHGHPSPDSATFDEFCAAMVARYAPMIPASHAALPARHASVVAS